MGPGGGKRHPALRNVLVAMLVAGACTPAAERQRTPPTTAAATSNAAERRIAELETQLAERDREIAVVHAEIAAVQARTHGETRSTADGIEPPHAGAGPEDPPFPSPALSGAPSDIPLAPATSPAVPASDGAAGGPSPVEPASAPGTEGMVGADAWPAAAQRQIAGLEARLAAEVQRRQQVETEMAHLRADGAGSAAPVPAGVEGHLRGELEQARREIIELQTVLAAERAEHAELLQRFSALHEQVELAAAAPAPTNEEIAALTERQRRALVDIQRELDASGGQEQALRTAAERAQAAVSLADEVRTLRTENTTLQQRLDEQRQQNRTLSAKLQLAGRVTDLIFKMRAGAAPPPSP